MWKPFDWFDVKQMRPMFGAKVQRGGNWLPVAIGGKPALFETAEMRDQVMTEKLGSPAA